MSRLTKSQYEFLVCVKEAGDSGLLVRDTEILSVRRDVIALGANGMIEGAQGTYAGFNDTYDCWTFKLTEAGVSELKSDAPREFAEAKPPTSPDELKREIRGIVARVMLEELIRNTLGKV